MPTDTLSICGGEYTLSTIQSCLPFQLSYGYHLTLSDSSKYALSRLPSAEITSARSPLPCVLS
jgi:hypothetical protein